MKGLFIPGITAEMFINGCLEGIEALMAEGEIYDIDYTGWIPVSERLPEKEELVLVTVWNEVSIAWRNKYGWWDSAENIYEKGDVTAWQPLPKPYKESDSK